MFSRTTQYAIRALVFLAVQPAGKLSGAKEIAQAQDIPKPFLWKLLHRLQQKKLVRSFKGVGGGYELAEPARRIRLYDVVAAFESAPPFQGCILGLPPCPQSAPCPLDYGCRKINGYGLKLLKQNTIADLTPKQLVYGRHVNNASR